MYFYESQNNASPFGCFKRAMPDVFKCHLLRRWIIYFYRFVIHIKKYFLNFSRLTVKENIPFHLHKHQKKLSDITQDE